MIFSGEGYTLSTKILLIINVLYTHSNLEEGVSTTSLCPGS